MEVVNTCDYCGDTMSAGEKYYYLGGYKICSNCANRRKLAEIYKKLNVVPVQYENSDVIEVPVC